MSNELTLGRVITQRRAALGLSLKDLGQQVHKEDGHGISAQYLHDIEKDRRMPSPQVLAELAKALRVEVHYLAALAGQPPADLIAYLRERPERAAAVAGLFARARATGFTDWGSIEIFGGQQAAASAAH